MIRGVIFDLGGVVFEWSNATTYNWIEERYGIPAADFKRIAEDKMPEFKLAGCPRQSGWRIPSGTLA